MARLTEERFARFDKLRGLKFRGQIGICLSSGWANVENCATRWREIRAMNSRYGHPDFLTYDTIETLFFFFFALSINVRILYEQPAFTAREVHRFWWKFWRRRIWRGCSTGLGLKQALVSRLTSRYKVTLIKMPPLLSFIFFWHLITRDKIVIKIHRLNERFKDKRMRYKLTDSSHTMIYNEKNHPFHANLC